MTGDAVALLTGSPNEDTPDDEVAGVGDCAASDESSLCAASAGAVNA